MNMPPLPPPIPEAGEDPPLAPPGRGKFGKMVRAYRKYLHLTLEAVSQATGLNSSTLSLIECGKRIPPELADVHELARVLEIASNQSTFERFVTLAIEERNKSKRRGQRKPGIARKVVHRGQAAARAELGTLQPAGPVPMEQPANPVAGPPGRDAILATMLRSVLDLELAEKIDHIRVLTKAGQEYVIRTDP
ncbi:MAG: helix-turn-helix domain-containing protein [Candidatus Solibacter usitatus]|nr:helix-turn-helix domain-containing protein [Candidatus Solibacter usitatus]